MNTAGITKSSYCINYCKSNHYNDKQTNDDIKLFCPCLENTINGLLDIEHQSNLIQCHKCKTYQHKACINSSENNPRYLCPTCQFNTYDHFLSPWANLLPPTWITPQHETYDFSFDFSLSALSSLLHSNHKDNEYYIIIQVLKQSKKVPYNISWPFYTTLTFNSKHIKIHGQKEPIAFSLSAKPLPIKNYYNICSSYQSTLKKKTITTSKLHLNINWDSMRKGVLSQRNSVVNYILSVDCVQIQRVDINYLISKTNKISDIPTLFQWTNHDVNDETVINEEISWIEALTGVDAITIPARGENCLHKACFDLRTFYEFKRKNYTRMKDMKCPVCHKNPGVLYIDEVINNAILGCRSEKYQKCSIDKDYTVTILTEEEEDCKISSDDVETSSVINWISDSDNDCWESGDYLWTGQDEEKDSKKDSMKNKKD